MRNGLISAEPAPVRADKPGGGRGEGRKFLSLRRRILGRALRFPQFGVAGMVSNGSAQVRCSHAPLLPDGALLGSPTIMIPRSRSDAAPGGAITPGSFPAALLSTSLFAGGEPFSRFGSGLRLNRVFYDPKPNGGPGESGPESS
jgi:hypothetical protein